MPRISVFIPEPDRILFWRCRILNAEITALLEHMPPIAVLESLKRLPLDQLPPTKRRETQTTIARIERDAAELNAKQEDFDQLVTEAEYAAQRIENIHLRRFTRLYCLDGWSCLDAAKESGIHERTAYRYASMLNKTPDSALSEGIDHGQQAYPAGTGGR